MSVEGKRLDAPTNGIIHSTFFQFVKDLNLVVFTLRFVQKKSKNLFFSIDIVPKNDIYGRTSSPRNLSAASHTGSPRTGTHTASSAVGSATTPTLPTRSL